jgi:hypothetical protein
MTHLLARNPLLGLIAVGLSLLTAAPIHAADPPHPKAEHRARNLVENNQWVIAAFAHPTSKFVNMRHMRTESTSDGFKVTYEVNYIAFRGCGCRFYSNLAFSFDADGSFRTVETAGRNCTVAPFTACDAVLGVAQAIIKNEPQLRNNYEFLKLIEKSDARDLLKFVLLLSR